MIDLIDGCRPILGARRTECGKGRGIARLHIAIDREATNVAAGAGYGNELCPRPRIDRRVGGGVVTEGDEGKKQIASGRRRIQRDGAGGSITLDETLMLDD